MTNNPELSNDVLKCKMVAYCQMASMNKWCSDDGIFISCLNGNSLLMNNPHQNCKIAKRDDILEVDMANIGSDKFDAYIADLMIHFLIHDIGTKNNCVIFVDCGKYLEGILNCGGFRAISQESMLIGANKIGIFDYDAFARDFKEKSNSEQELGEFLVNQKRVIGAALKKNNKLLLRNHGVISLGYNVEEAWLNTFQLMYAIETHMKLGDAFLADNVVLPSIVVQDLVRSFDVQGQTGMVTLNKQSSTPRYLNGEMEFEAMMRYLDSLGMDIGYDYKLGGIFRKGEDLQPELVKRHT